MTNAFIGEIRIFGFTFAPRNWLFCDGQLLSIAQNTALFSIIGTYYGGNGQTTFAVPNFQGRSGVQQGTGPGLSTYDLGEMSGSETVTLTLGQIPIHAHVINTQAASTATQSAKLPTSNAYLGNSFPDALFNDQTPSPTTSFSPSAIGPAGQSLPHENMQPYLVLNYCMCQYGVFPSRN
jgi:microcystin-dependent protein